jgi:AcrR family transcriptional regulator
MQVDTCIKVESSHDRGSHMPKQIDVDRLFEATVATFAEKGYRATTTLEIAKRAGLNEVTLFRRHGGKAALVNAALTYTLAKSPFAGIEVTDDVAADLTALVRAYNETTRQYGAAVMTLLTEVPRHPELREAMAALMPNLRNAVQIIAAHQQLGSLMPGEPLQQLLVLIAPLMMLGLWARTGQDPVVAEFDPNVLVAGFLDGHRIPPS